MMCLWHGQTLEKMGVTQISGIDVSKDDVVPLLAEKLGETKLDAVINNAGVLKFEEYVHHLNPRLVCTHACALMLSLRADCNMTHVAVLYECCVHDLCVHVCCVQLGFVEL